MNKLEEHIKRNLQEREITPSAGAWDKISGQIVTTDTSRSRKGYWWAIAAGISGLIVLSVGILNNKSAEDIEQQLVIEQTSKGTKAEVNQEENSAKHIENATTIVEQQVQDTELVKSSPVVKKTILKAKAVPVVAHKEGSTKKKNIIDDVEPPMDLVIDSKLEEVLTQVTQLENDTKVVTDAEIDSLLLTAQRELLHSKAFKLEGKIDAMALLNEVELDIYDSQRNPLFKQLKEEFFKLRTAFADRNK